MRKKFGLMAAALVISVTHASAADVTVLGATTSAAFGDPICNVRLSGPIEAGDNKKIESALDTINQRRDNPSGDVTASITLCLNSPGGSYVEGLHISDFLLERHFGTMIGPDEICYSACALIFMSGNWAFEGKYFPVRKLHVTGQLGFHAPYIKGIPQQTYSSLDLEDAYKESIRAIRDLLKLGQKHRVSDDFMSKTLLLAMLDKGPNEIFLVDTIYKAAKLNIVLYGGRQAAVTVIGLCNACILFHQGSGIELSLDDPPAGCDASSEGVERHGNQIWFRGYGSEGLGYCVAQAPSPYGAPFGVNRNIIWSKNDRLKPDDFYIPHNWYLYSPTTIIQNLK